MRKQKGFAAIENFTERKNFAAVDEILRRVRDRAVRSVIDAKVYGVNSGRARGLTATDVNHRKSAPELALRSSADTCA